MKSTTACLYIAFGRVEKREKNNFNTLASDEIVKVFVRCRKNVKKSFIYDGVADP
jgi:hypothetical protein